MLLTDVVLLTTESDTFWFNMGIAYKKVVCYACYQTYGLCLLLNVQRAPQKMEEWDLTIKGYK